VEAGTLSIAAEVAAAPEEAIDAPAAVRETFDAAFADLFRSAYRTAYRLIGVRSDAEDIAQEACARACVRWKRLDDPRAWVGRVSANLALDRWRRQRTARRHGAAAAPRAVPTDDGFDGRRVDLHRALEQLPPRQRQVVVLRYLADLSEQQTAELLGCAVGTVKAHASRGLAALRVALGDAEEA
jgi:RNA polymerase sigma-70 factor (sigma-E family)